MTTTMSSINLGEVNRERIRRIVVAAGVEGVRISVVMAKTGLSVKTVGDHLRALYVARKIEPSATTGPGVRWGKVGIRAVHEARRSREAKRREATRAKRAHGATVAQEVERWLEQLPVRIIVPATQATPLPIRGPVSVWALAA